MKASVSRSIARHMVEVRVADLPTAEITAARMSLIDILGTAIAARGGADTEPLLAVCRAERTVGESTVWATGEKVAPRQAAFTNSVFAALLDYDSVFHPGVVHSDLVVVPAATAVGEAVRCTGEELLGAIAFGNDLLCRLSLVSPPPRKPWFFTSVYGVIAAALVAARLLKCDPAKASNAMGLALFNAAGTYQPMTERSSSKQAMAAFAVQAGIQCAYLAAAGFEGVAQPLEGEHGILAMYQDGDLSIVTDGLGSVFLGSQVGRKPYPSCQCNHAPIDATLILRGRHGIRAADVADMQVFLSPHACHVVGSPYNGQEPSQMGAQFSVQYSIACALLHGRFGLEEIGPSAISDPNTIELARRVRVTEDPLNPNTYVPATVKITMRDGQEFSQTSAVNKGGIDLPMTEDDMFRKFENCMLAARPGLTKEAVEGAFGGLLAIDRAPETNKVITDVCRIIS